MRTSATVRRGKRLPTGNNRARWCSGRKTAVSWSRSGTGQVRGNRASTFRTRPGRGPAAIGEIGRSAVVLGMADGLIREKKTWIRGWWLERPAGRDEPPPGFGQTAERVLPTVGAGKRCTVRWRSKLSCEHGKSMTTVS